MTLVKCILPTCCSALSRYRSITGCCGLLLKLVEWMDSRIHLHLFQICWRPSVAQKESVSGILVQGKRLFAEEVDEENAGGSCSIAQVCKSGYPVQQLRIAAPLQQQWCLGLFSLASITAV